MKITETMSREERRAAVALTTARRDLLILMHQKNSSAAETVAELIGRIGYQAARETIAEAVRGRGAWDGRISEAARIWAAEIDTAADRGMLLDHYLISDAIHPAHIDQIALAAAEYDREKPETTFVYDARRIRWFLLKAIRRDAQGAALDAVALGFEAETRKDISASQRRQLSAIYDAWERGWCALEEAEAAEAAAAEEAPAEEIADEEPDEEARKASSLAAYLVEFENFTEDEAAEIERNYDGSFSCGSWEYQVMTDEEADEAARGEILESLWAFRPEFILSHMHDHGPTSVREDEAICKALRIMQEELCESATPIIRALIADLDDFVSDAIQADGRGHFISRYDGDEIELGEFYAYRQN